MSLGLALAAFTSILLAGIAIGYALAIVAETPKRRKTNVRSILPMVRQRSAVAGGRQAEVSPLRVAGGKK